MRRLKAEQPHLPSFRAACLGLLLIWLLNLMTLNGSAASHGYSTNGYVLLGELNCTACHSANELQAQWISAKGAPTLGEVGDRVNPAWLQTYLESPQRVMPGTTMPNLLHQMPEAKRIAAAEALTHFLISTRKSVYRETMPDKAAAERGDNLYNKIGCTACHDPKPDKQELASSKAFPDLGEKWSFEALRGFLLDPLKLRPGGRMPNLHLTDREASDIAHYLLRKVRVPAPLEVAHYDGWIRSFDDMDSEKPWSTGPSEGFSVAALDPNRDRAARFFTWIKVEQEGDYVFHLSANGAARLSVAGDWLLGGDSWESEEVNASVKLHLTSDRHELTLDFVKRGGKPPGLKVEVEGPGMIRQEISKSRLSSEKEPVPVKAPFDYDPAKAAEGKVLYEKLQCAACHEGKPLATPPPSIAHLRRGNGCLSEAPGERAMDYQLDANERNALREAVVALNRKDLSPPSERQQLTHAMVSLRCFSCHVREGMGGVNPDRDAYFTSNGEDLGEEGRLPPRLEGVGDKLQQPWMTKVLAEGAGVRPYLNTRMPGFGPEHAERLARLFSALDLENQAVPPSPDSETLRREAGRKLIGTDGLSCIACHKFNRQPAHAFQVIDLATTTTRLREHWFREFLLDPARFHPGTRMPSFWPNGASPMQTLLDGKTDRQHAAIWTYLADTNRARFPEGLSRQNMELIVGGEAVVYRGKLWEAGFRAVAVGYPGQFNAAYDAEEMRLALLWRGRFLNAGPHWGVQGMGKIRPLGTDVITLPHGSPLAILKDAAQPWPAQTAKELGMKFRGYQLDGQKRPTLRYSFQSLDLEDFLTPIEAPGNSAMKRTVSFRDQSIEGLHLRLASGEMKELGKGIWLLKGSTKISLVEGTGMFSRGTGNRQELLIPIATATGKHQIEIEYAW